MFPKPDYLQMVSKLSEYVPKKKGKEVASGKLETVHARFLPKQITFNSFPSDAFI